MSNTITEENCVELQNSLTAPQSANAEKFYTPERRQSGLDRISKKNGKKYLFVNVNSIRSTLPDGIKRQIDTLEGAL
jgi:hypothetical protein